MNAIDMMRYGHQTVNGAVDGLPEKEWYTPGVTGVWSVREIIAHLASFEHLLVDVLHSLLGDEPTPTLDRFLRLGHAKFNDEDVARREEQFVSEVWAEYTNTHLQTLDLLSQLPAELFRRKGVLPWYGNEYDLEDLLVYQYYAHKREHSAEINVFRDKIARAAAGV